MEPQLSASRVCFFFSSKRSSGRKGTTYHGDLGIRETTKERLDAVEGRIATALGRAGRLRDDICLVAVSKKFDADRIREAYQSGLRHFGENYVQEFAGKHPTLQDLDGAEFHLIGHLQSNKSRQAVTLFDVVESVDSARLLARLETAADEAQKQMNVLLEIKLSDEESKTGAAEADMDAMLEAAANNRYVHVAGLMTVPPWSDDAEASRPYFQRLARLAAGRKLPQLSMGMSNDFEVGIEEGATIIRVGTALFGARPAPVPKAPDHVLK